MKRWAWNIFCLFSLLVFVSSVAIWVRSYFFAEAVAWRTQPTPTRWLRYGVGWKGGALGVGRTRVEHGVPQQDPTGWNYSQWRSGATIYERASPTNRIYHDFHGFQFVYDITTDSSASWSTQSLVLPLWLFLPAALPPVLWLRGWRRSRRRGFPVGESSASHPELNPPPAKV